MNSIAANLPPKISADDFLRVSIGEKIIYQITVNDSDDEVFLDVYGGLPQGSTLEQIDEGEYVFQWTLQEVTEEPLVFIATDTGGASSTFAPVVHICACVNGGICSLDGLLSGTHMVVMNCNCNEGSCFLY